MTEKTNRENPSKLKPWLRGVGWSVVLLGAFSATAFGQLQQPPPQAQIDPETQQELMEVQTELQQVNDRIQTIEQKAMESEELKAAQEEYMEQLKVAAIESSPEVEPKLKRQEALIGELEKSPELQKPAEERTPEFNEKLDEFKQLRNEISPVVQSVQAKPEVQQQYETFKSAVIEEMKEIDPQTDQLLAQREELYSRFMSLSGQGQ